MKNKYKTEDSGLNILKYTKFEIGNNVKYKDVSPLVII